MSAQGLDNRHHRIARHVSNRLGARLAFVLLALGYVILFVLWILEGVLPASRVWMFSNANQQQPVVQTPAPHEPRAEPKGDLEARLEPNSEVEIRPSLIDYPVHLKANDGDFVQKGQVLVELGDSKLQESVQQAEAVLKLVRVGHQTRQARLAQLDKGQRRFLPAAGPTRHGSNPEDEIDKTRLQQAEASVARAKAVLAETRIIAPIAGYVIQRQSDGELSKPDVALMKIVDIGSMKISIEVPQEKYSRVVTNQEARVAVNDVPSRTFVGKVLRKMAVQRGRSRENTVLIAIPNPEAVLKPGMHARAGLTFEHNNEPRLAPTAAWLAESSRSRSAGSPVVQQSDAELLSELKTLTQTMKTMGGELEYREQAAKITGEASRQYFLALKELLTRLREHSSNTNRPNFEKTAEAIDDLPALHVDEELLAVSSDISKALREIAERRRASSRDLLVVDCTYWERVQRGQRDSIAVKSQGLQRINTAVTEIRFKLTRKYNREFLKSADHTQARPVVTRNQP